MLDEEEKDEEQEQEEWSKEHCQREQNHHFGKRVSMIDYAAYAYKTKPLFFKIDRHLDVYITLFT